MKTKGEITGWTTFSKNDFELAAGEKTEADVTVSVPRGAEYKDYEGKLVILFQEK